MASPAAASVRPPRPKKEPQTLVIPKNAAEEQKLKLERLMKNPVSRRGLCGPARPRHPSGLGDAALRTPEEAWGGGAACLAASYSTAAGRAPFSPPMPSFLLVFFLRAVVLRILSTLPLSRLLV